MLAIKRAEKKLCSNALRLDGNKLAPYGTNVRLITTNVSANFKVT